MRFWEALRFSPATSPGLGHTTPVLSSVDRDLARGPSIAKKWIINIAQQHSLGTPVKEVAGNSVPSHAPTGISWLGVWSLRSILGDHSCRQPKVRKHCHLEQTTTHCFMLKEKQKLLRHLHTLRKHVEMDPRLSGSSHSFVAFIIRSSPPRTLLLLANLHLPFKTYWRSLSLGPSLATWPASQDTHMVSSSPWTIASACRPPSEWTGRAECGARQGASITEGFRQMIHDQGWPWNGLSFRSSWR